MRTAPLTTNEKSTRAWQVIQSERMKRQSAEVEPPSTFAVSDDTALVGPSQVVSGQWEPGLVLHACHLTEEGRLLLGMKNVQSVGMIDPVKEGGSAGVAGNSDNHDELPEEDLDSMEAREFGEKLCEKTASDWAVAQREDETSSIAIENIHAGIAVADISDGGMPDSVDNMEVRRLVAQGKLVELPDSQKILVKRLSVEPASRDGRNPGQYERLLGEEPVRIYVPLLLRPWVMDCTHKEAVHLREKVTLRMVQRYMRWIGMADSVKWWIRKCYSTVLFYAAADHSM